MSFLFHFPKNGRRESIDSLLERKDHALFLDYDGVVNTNGKGSNPPKFDSKCIRNLNRFCLKYHYCIVVSSSWRNYYNYQEILYSAGLHKNVRIYGKTEQLQSREKEIQNYMAEHPYLDQYLVIDDEDLKGMDGHFIHTESSKGFNREKYQEAVMLHKKMSQKDE